MLNLLVSMLLSLLPKAWRRGWGASWEIDLSRGALVSGVLECVGCVLALGFGYLMFAQEKMGEFSAMLIAKGAEGAMADKAMQYATGMITLMEYLIRPASVALIYFAFEGVVRLSAALISDEVVGTMPLYVVAWGQQQAARARAERALGPRIADEVQAGDGKAYTFRILSCRPKPGWDHLITVSYRDELYEVAQREQGPPPRPYIYLLRPAPAHKIVRGLEQYDPEAVLQKK